jgi:hypothetical protein
MEPWWRLNPAHSVGHMMIMSEVKIPVKQGIKEKGITAGNQNGSERSGLFLCQQFCQLCF